MPPVKLIETKKGKKEGGVRDGGRKKSGTSQWGAPPAEYSQVGWKRKRKGKQEGSTLESVKGRGLEGILDRSTSYLGIGGNRKEMGEEGEEKGGSTKGGVEEQYSSVDKSHINVSWRKKKKIGKRTDEKKGGQKQPFVHQVLESSLSIKVGRMKGR